MAMNVEAEIRDLKRRVSELEGAFGFLTEQVKGVHRDLLAFQVKVEGRFDRLEKDVRELRRDMPRIVASTMREVLRERGSKRRKEPWASGSCGASLSSPQVR